MLVISSKRASFVVAVLVLVGAATASCASGAVPATRPQTSSTHLTGAACSANRAAGTMTFVSPFGFDASVGILDVFAAQSLGYFSDECLTVQFVTNSYTPNQLVSSGQGTITGEGSAADALLAIAGGANFVGISTFGDTSDYALLTRTSITKLTELEGKVLGYHTAVPVVLTEMLKAAGVDVAKVDEVNDTSYDPTLLIHGPYDALQAYRSNEPLTLRADGDKFNEFLPSSYGVSGTFNVQVANRSFLAKHPQAVADFLRAELHAYDYCAVHVSACIAIEAKDARAAGQTYDTAHETAEWRFETNLVAGHTLSGKGVGVESTAEWAPEVTALVDNHLAKASELPSTDENVRLAASLYHGSKLIWPGS